MIAVILRRSKYSGEFYYSPVNRESLAFVNNEIGYCWFDACRWQEMKERAVKAGLKLTSRWYHVKRLMQTDYDY